MYVVWISAEIETLSRLLDNGKNVGIFSCRYVVGLESVSYNLRIKFAFMLCTKGEQIKYSFILDSKNKKTALYLKAKI